MLGESIGSSVIWKIQGYVISQQGMTYGYNSSRESVDLGFTCNRPVIIYNKRGCNGSTCSCIHNEEQSVCTDFQVVYIQYQILRTPSLTNPPLCTTPPGTHIASPLHPLAPNQSMWMHSWQCTSDIICGKHHFNSGTCKCGKGVSKRGVKYEYIGIWPHLVGINCTGNGNLSRLIPNMGIKTGNGVLWHCMDNKNSGFWESEKFWLFKCICLQEIITHYLHLPHCRLNVVGSS